MVERTDAEARTIAGAARARGCQFSDAVPRDAVRAAAGWGGDRLVMYEGPNAGWVVDWHTVWDTQPDADEFLGRAQALGPFVGSEMGFVTSPLGVRVVIASSHALLVSLGASGSD